jgi:SAM-dependent methyltransferase
LPLKLQADISARVKAQYEAFPYPHYSLLLPLRTQEAYASNSLFAARVLEQRGETPALRLNGSAGVLLAGCGDTFPYMATFWEPRRQPLTAVDLSAGSLRRARLRCLPRLRNIAWRQGNLEDPDFEPPSRLSHIDCYGVLHHLADPALVLRRFAQALSPGGTARIMVYNSEARNWIHHVQRAFALLGLSAFRREDRARGQRLLERLAEVSPALRERFAPMRRGAFADASRFVDTFLHAREARLDLPFWLRALEESGLRLIGVFDRYGELDDLPNPLLEPPDADAWRERIADRRFENNLELYLAKSGATGAAEMGGTGAGADPRIPERCRLPSSQFLKTPPLSWFEYAETRSLPWTTRRLLWTHFLRRLCGGDRGPEESAEAWLGRMPTSALQRLARLGALFPDDFRSRELRALLLRPLQDGMEPPEFPAPAPVRGHAEIRMEVRRMLEEGGLPLRRLEPVMNRLDAAQRP